jgi:hypothetical protein
VRVKFQPMACDECGYHLDELPLGQALHQCSDGRGRCRACLRVWLMGPDELKAAPGRCEHGIAGGCPECDPDGLPF